MGSAVELNGHPSPNDPLMGSLSDKEKTEVVALMKKVNKTIADGAMSFLTTEYMYMGAYVVVFSGILMFFTGWETTVSFVVGALTSIMCGWIGMSIAVFTNVRTTHEAWAGLDRGFAVAIQGGCVMGFSLVSLGVVCLIALFGRVGGGIYTKAADVGADLSGKNSYGMEEDDYRNPGCIADNVGDNSKKYITGGGLGKEFCKGSEAHKNSVTGDTVGDPLKDTSGPALNIVMKLTAILSLVFGSAINDYSNAQGGPFWMKA